MKKMNSLHLLEQLQSDTREMIVTATRLKQEDPAVLLEQPAPGKWSVIQVLEHLNSYGRYYLPAIEKSLHANKPAKPVYKPGWLGDFFTRLMQPREDGVIANKMKAPKDHRPSFSVDAVPVLEDFLLQQHRLLSLLEQAKQKDIAAIRTPISISKLIRLKLGDTFRFLVAHEQRHFVQVSNTLAAVKGAKDISPAVRLAMPQ